MLELIRRGAMEEPEFDPFEQPPLVQALLVALRTLVVDNARLSDRHSAC
jgi:hypothetical protein